MQTGEGLVIGQGNRDAMLEMLACDPATRPDGPVDAAAVEQLRRITTDYLAQYMADQPSGWKWIILACIFRTFPLECPTKWTPSPPSRVPLSRTVWRGWRFRRKADKQPGDLSAFALLSPICYTV